MGSSFGEHEAIIGDDCLIDLYIRDVQKVQQIIDGYFLNTGVPHLVHFVDDLHIVDVEIEDRQLWYDARFQPEEAYLNFVKQDEDHLIVYTYERGMECETLACGTGITAAALSTAFKTGKEEGKYTIQTKGCELETL